MKKILNLLTIIILANVCALTQASSENNISKWEIAAGLGMTGLSLAALTIPTPNYPHNASKNLICSGAALCGLAWTGATIAVYLQREPSKQEKKLAKFDRNASDISNCIGRDMADSNDETDITAHLNQENDLNQRFNYRPVDDRHVDSHPNLFSPQLIQDHPDLKNALKKYVWVNNRARHRTAHPKFDTEITGIRQDIQSKHQEATIKRHKSSEKFAYTSLVAGAAGILLCGAGIYKWWHGA